MSPGGLSTSWFDMAFLSKGSPPRTVAALTRILREAFCCERRKHGIFGSILEIRTRMYFSTDRKRRRGGKECEL